MTRATRSLHGYNWSCTSCSVTVLRPRGCSGDHQPHHHPISIRWPGRPRVGAANGDSKHLFSIDLDQAVSREFPFARFPLAMCLVSPRATVWGLTISLTHKGQTSSHFHLPGPGTPTQRHVPRGTQTPSSSRDAHDNLIHEHRYPLVSHLRHQDFLCHHQRLLLVPERRKIHRIITRRITEW